MSTIVVHRTVHPVAAGSSSGLSTPSRWCPWRRLEAQVGRRQHFAILSDVVTVPWRFPGDRAGAGTGGAVRVAHTERGRDARDCYGTRTAAAFSEAVASRDSNLLPAKRNA